MKNEVKELKLEIEELKEQIEELKELNRFLVHLNNRYYDELERLNKECDTYMKISTQKQSRIDKATEYITSYESISTIQGLDKIEQNKKLDERTMNVMVERYLKVHHNLLNILQGENKEKVDNNE